MEVRKITVNSNIEKTFDFFNSTIKKVTGKNILTMKQLKALFENDSVYIQNIFTNSDGFIFPAILTIAKENHGDIVIISKYVDEKEVQKIISSKAVKQDSITTYPYDLLQDVMDILQYIDTKQELYDWFRARAQVDANKFKFNESMILAKNKKEANIAYHAERIADLMYNNMGNDYVNNHTRRIMNAIKEGKQYKAVKSFGLGNYDVRSLMSEFGKDRVEAIMKHAKAIGLDISDKITFA